MKENGSKAIGGRILRGMLTLALVAGGLAAVGDAQANRFVGDLVYCDLDANGLYDGEDYPLNGVDVRLHCTTSGSGAVCVDYVTTTGTLHSSTDGLLDTYMYICGAEAPPWNFAVTTWDPRDPSQLDGRYLFDTFGGCGGLGFTQTCTVRVDESTLPSDCNGVVVPNADGFPFDGNGDGDFCDDVDGPFPEGQVLGNNTIPAHCELAPDPAPGDSLYNVIINLQLVSDSCSIYADFGYTPEPVERFATHTPGYWKNHPVAVDMFLPLEYCGQTLGEVCEAHPFLSANGGGINQFHRHAVSGLLNCAAFGCPLEIEELIAEGSMACSVGGDYDWGVAGTILDVFNNSGTDIDDGLDAGSADPHFCGKPGGGGKKKK